MESNQTSRIIKSYDYGKEIRWLIWPFLRLKIVQILADEWKAFNNFF